MTLDTTALEESLLNARQALLDARTPGGWWEGELSSSALSTATAVFALHLFYEHATHLPAELEKEILDFQTEKACERLIRDGISWLALHQNADGGWGDTFNNISNISTTALCWAAFASDATAPSPIYRNVTVAAEAWLTAHAGGCDPDHLVPAIIKRYGKDKTFSVPILTMCALAGRLGAGRAAWRSVPQLPFELAAFPQRGFKWLRLPVVSYALPALIAIGQVRHKKRPTLNPFPRVLRAGARKRTLALLGRIQPESGGFLEATPLTSFVVMSLVGAGAANDPVVKRGIQFLINSARRDGSWPIDTNLATWVTTLAVNALAINPDFRQAVPEKDRRKIHEWLLSQQYRREHPYTLADPGAWAWTPLSGSVPDADDTPGALLALKNLGIIDDRTKEAAAAGIKWLLDLQNRDGGIPTFCRGWGKLPFDRSSADLTAHTLRAVAAWIEDSPAERSSTGLVGSALRTDSSSVEIPVRSADPTRIAPGRLAHRAKDAVARAVDYLVQTQQSDGTWLPLWFGNQHAPDDINPTYGTARVLLSAQAGRAGGAAWAQRLAAAVDWLLSSQRPGGGWGAGGDTPPSIEETALAIEALADVLRYGLALSPSPDTPRPVRGQGPLPEQRETPSFSSSFSPSPGASADGIGAVTDQTQLPRPDAHPLVNLIDHENVRAAIARGVTWLVDATDRGTRFEPSPIGFYFAKLWYFEKLYPLIFTVAAMESVRAVTATT